VSGPAAEDLEVKLLVDSGAVYSLLPTEVWRRLGLAPARTETFVLADGTEMRRDISECLISLPQGTTHTTVILGEPGDVGLLGTLTLEALGLMLDPFNRTLRRAVLRMV